MIFAFLIEKLFIVLNTQWQQQHILKILRPNLSQQLLQKEQKNNFVQRIILQYKARRQARKILKAIGEADQIHRGNKKGKPYDQFLQEL